MEAPTLASGISPIKFRLYQSCSSLQAVNLSILTMSPLTSVPPTKRTVSLAKAVMAKSDTPMGEEDEAAILSLLWTAASLKG